METASDVHRFETAKGQVTLLSKTGDGRPWETSVDRRYDTKIQSYRRSHDMGYFVVEEGIICRKLLLEGEGQPVPDNAFGFVLQGQLQVFGRYSVDAEEFPLSAINFNVCEVPEFGRAILVDGISVGVGMVVRPERAVQIFEETGFSSWYQETHGEPLPIVLPCNGLAGRFPLPQEA